MKRNIVSLGIMFALSSTALHAEIVQQFKDPTFSGQGWASHVLTLEQMRQSAKNSVDSKAASEKAAADAAAANTPLAKFMALFTGQVYSQLATQLTNNLFKECTKGDCDKGSFMVSDTQQIQWIKDIKNSIVTLSVYDGKKDSNGNFIPNGAFTQQIVVPISQFSF